jgi:hypothetical protein
MRDLFLEQAIWEFGRYSEDAAVVINFQKAGNASQRQANSGYEKRMMGLFAEGNHGPIHIGAAVTLEGDVDFDQVVLVYYPGLRYFFDRVRSQFFAGIFGDKQLGDNLAIPTVPILHAL